MLDNSKVKHQSSTGFKGDSQCIQGEERVDPTPVRVDTTISSSPTLFINIPGDGYSVSTTKPQMTQDLFN